MNTKTTQTKAVEYTATELLGPGIRTNPADYKWRIESEGREDYTFQLKTKVVARMKGNYYVKDFSLQELGLLDKKKQINSLLPPCFCPNYHRDILQFIQTYRAKG